MPSEPSNGSSEADGAEPLWRTETKTHPAVAVLLVTAVAVVAVAVAGVSLVGAETAAADGPAELETSIVTVSENGTAEIDVQTDGADAFEITVGDEEAAGYALRATVTPSDGGVTTLVFDHAETSGDGTPLTAEGDAAVDIDHETALDEPIDPAGYEIELFPDGGDEAADVGTLMVETGGESGEDGTGDGDAVEAVDAADVLIEPRATAVTVPVELDDGAAVEMRLRSAGNASTNYIKTQEATVTDGEATATFNASVAEPGDRATLTVRGNKALDDPVTRDVLVVEDVESPESGDTDDGAPGFGPLVAALALLGAALIARVRE